MSRATDSHTFADLRQRLLYYGGRDVIADPHEPDLDALVSRGQLFTPDATVSVAGRDHLCHQNVARYYDDPSRLAAYPGDDHQIVTGWALSPDRCWRQHSWLRGWDRDRELVFETTDPRTKYFGIVLTGADADAFVEQYRNHASEAESVPSL